MHRRVLYIRLHLQYRVCIYKSSWRLLLTGAFKRVFPWKTATVYDVPTAWSSSGCGLYLRQKIVDCEPYVTFTFGFIVSVRRYSRHFLIFLLVESIHECSLCEAGETEGLVL